MNNDDIDFLEREHLVLRSYKGHGSGEEKIVIEDDSGHILGDLDAIAELRDKFAGIGDLGVRTSAEIEAMDSIFHVHRERKTTIQAIQKISTTELMSIPEYRREVVIDHIKERALHGLIEQADLINAVSYEEGSDPMTHEKIIIAKLKVIIDE